MDVTALVTTPPLAHPYLAVDQTGVGSAVIGMLRQARPKVVRPPVLITTGRAGSLGDAGIYHVAEKEPAGVFQVLLGQHRLKIADLPVRELLARELLASRVQVTVAGSATFESWRGCSGGRESADNNPLGFHFLTVRPAEPPRARRIGVQGRGRHKRGGEPVRSRFSCSTVIKSWVTNVRLSATRSTAACTARGKVTSPCITRLLPRPRPFRVHRAGHAAGPFALPPAALAAGSREPQPAGPRLTACGEERRTQALFHRTLAEARKLQRYLLERQQYRCAITGLPLEDRSAVG